MLKEEALLLMNKNIDVSEKALKLAARQVLPLIHWLGYWKENLKLHKNVSVSNSVEIFLLLLVLSRAHKSLRPQKMEFTARSSKGRPFVPIWRISQILK